MHTEQVLGAVAVGGGIVTILGGGGLLGWFWRKEPERQQARERTSAVADAILGEPEVRDRSGEVIQPSRPGLVHRVGNVEDAVIEFRHAIGLLTETLKRLDNLDARIQVLEANTVERIVTRVESAEMWRAVADRDVIDGDEDTHS